MQISTVKLDELLLKLSQTKGASDLLITVGKPAQLRVHNDITELDYPTLTPEDAERLCLSILSDDQKEKMQTEMQIDTGYVVENVGRFRVNVYKQKGCYAMAARIVVEDVPSFEALGLPDIMGYFSMMPRGLVLITGPIGTGKTTTVAAMLDYINQRRRCHIISIEDPIEYVHTHKLATIDQREVGLDTGSFGSALRSILRQSADVVVVGEIRDRESAQAAITLAETGHLTIATLHTRGVVASVSRLVDMFPAEQSNQVRVQLSASLAGVVWQQLLPKKDNAGLSLATEVMTVTPAVRALVRSGRFHEMNNLIQAGKKHGMCTMEQSLQHLLAEGQVDEDWLSDNFKDFSMAKG